jgi:hypothetical protein
MYMRYAGGGVGHYRVTLTDTPANADETQDDFSVGDDVTADLPNFELEERMIVAEPAGLNVIEEDECIRDDNIEDHNSDSEGEEDNHIDDYFGAEGWGDVEENYLDDYLGAEDGEGGYLDAEDDEGYAAL